MKQYFTVLILFISLSGKAQELLELPPGTIKINDSLFIDKAPVDNLMYLEFTDKVQELWSYTLHDSLKSLELQNIDKSLLSTPLNPSQSEEIYDRVTMVENLNLSGDVDFYNYFNHPEYYYHPVIGISKEQAELFCQWRTDMVNLRWSTELKNSNKKYHKITYRLPTDEEYKLAKKVFLERGNLLVMNENSPLKIELKALRDSDRLVFYNIPEFTAKYNNFEPNSIPSANEDPVDDNYTFFRCICEVQK